MYKRLAANSGISLRCSLWRLHTYLSPPSCTVTIVTCTVTLLSLKKKLHFSLMFSTFSFTVSISTPVLLISLKLDLLHHCLRLDWCVCIAVTSSLKRPHPGAFKAPFTGKQERNKTSDPSLFRCCQSFEELGNAGINGQDNGCFISTVGNGKALYLFHRGFKLFKIHRIWHVTTKLTNDRLPQYIG